MGSAVPPPLASRRERAAALGLLLGWAALAGFCSTGIPPSIDLPAHGAQLEGLAGLARGDALVSSVYAGRFVPGYGLVYWLALPLAMLKDGATAARAASFASLFLFALGFLLLCRALRRPAATLLLALPLAFNVSYFYGFLPFAFAASIALLTLAAFAFSVRGGRTATALFLAGAALTWFAHLVVSLILLVTAWAAALSQPGERRAGVVRRVALASVLPVALSVPSVLGMLVARDPGRSGRTVLDPLSHLNWFFHNYRCEGVLAWTLPLLTTAVFVVLAWRRRDVEPRAPLAAFAALCLLYLVTPRHFAGASHFAVRLPALAAAAALLAADLRALPRWLAAALGVLSLASLAETAAFHQRFRREVAGLELVLPGDGAGRHAFQPLGGDRILGSRLPYLYHLGNWVTATRGGVGNDLLAGNPQEPLRYRAGEALPDFLRDFTPEQRARLDAIYLFGPGPAPSVLAGFTEVARAGGWRRLERRSP
jgi:hypothetical protein